MTEIPLASCTHTQEAPRDTKTYRYILPDRWDKWERTNWHIHTHDLASNTKHREAQTGYSQIFINTLAQKHPDRTC